MGILETKGLITKEIKYGDSSRILTVITQDMGKISVLAGGVRSNKSGLLATTQLFSYVSLTLFRSREKGLYKINQSEMISSFSSLRDSLSRMAYASYFCQVTNDIVQENAPDPQQLSLLLNTLYLLAADKLSYEQIKGVFAFRTLALQGLLPPLSTCYRCGAQKDLTHLSLQEGQVYCQQCKDTAPADAFHTGSSILQAISFIATAEDKQVFSFSLPESLLSYFSDLGSHCLSHFLERNFKTLDYLNKVRALEQGFSPTAKEETIS